MKFSKATISFWLLGMVYLGILVWLDRSNKALSNILELVPIIPILLLCSLLSYLFRFGRWHWLLTRAKRPPPLLTSILAYMSGFAFTATPGKVGELVRIRYLQPIGIEPPRVISAFIFERMLDLLVVLCLAAFAAIEFGLFPLIATFVLIILCVAILLVRYSHHMCRMNTFLHRHNQMRAARLLEVLSKGLGGTKCWLTPLDLLVATAMGIMGWGLTAFAFTLLAHHLAPGIPMMVAFSIYPASMLAGAASLVPGGLGTTEAVVVLLMTAMDTPIFTAALAAVGIRLTTLWFAILLGLISMLALEYGPAKGRTRSSKELSFTPKSR